jgi:hypothetical protein
MDSADCCRNATACIDMANYAMGRREQSGLFELARLWMRLAWELESDADLRDAVRDVRTFTRRCAQPRPLACPQESVHRGVI